MRFKVTCENTFYNVKVEKKFEAVDYDAANDIATIVLDNFCAAFETIVLSTIDKADDAAVSYALGQLYGNCWFLIEEI